MTANRPIEVSESHAEVVVGPWPPRHEASRHSSAAKLRTTMCTSAGHRPDTGSSTWLVRVPVLSTAEANVVADLLLRLAETSDDEISDLATEMAGRLRDRLGI